MWGGRFHAGAAVDSAHRAVLAFRCSGLRGSRGGLDTGRDRWGSVGRTPCRVVPLVGLACSPPGPMSDVFRLDCSWPRTSAWQCPRRQVDDTRGELGTAALRRGFMSGETVVTIVGNLVGDPSCGAPLRESRSRIPLRRTSRGFLDRASGTWKDGDAVFQRARLWRHRAENAAETLHDEGMRVTSSVDGSESGLPGSPRARSGPRSRSRRSDFPSGTPPPPSAMWPGQLAAVLLPGA